MLAGNQINWRAYFLDVTVDISVGYMTPSAEMKTIEKKAGYLFGLPLMDWVPLQFFLKRWLLFWKCLDSDPFFGYLIFYDFILFYHLF